MTHFLRLFVHALALLTIAAPCLADTVFTGSATSATSGDTLSAEATFHLSADGTQLTITLQNTGDPTTKTADLLSALLFDTNAGVTLTPVSAEGDLYGTSAGATAPAGNDPGVGWAYSPTSAGAAAALGYNSAILGAGMGINSSSTPNGNFGSGTKVKLDGSDYLIASAGTNLSGFTHKIPIAMDSITFILNVSGTFTMPTKVEFVYGTGTYGSEGHFTGHHTPLPSSLALLLTGLPGGYGFFVWRRRQSKAAN